MNWDDSKWGQGKRQKPRRQYKSLSRVSQGADHVMMGIRQSLLCGYRIRNRSNSGRNNLLGQQIIISIVHDAKRKIHLISLHIFDEVGFLEGHV